MANNQFINLEELSKTTQALLSKINEQSNLKVNKANVNAEYSEGTKIADIENVEIYAPEIDTSDFVTYNNLAQVAYTGIYNDLDNKPSLATVATSGNYNDLNNRPDISTYMVKGTDYVTAGQSPNHTLGTRATAEGISTVASGNYSHAEGSNTTASNYNSHAEGSNTTASGYYSHAEGRFTTASNYDSHAEGNSTIASGGSAHAEGGNTTASGTYAHAEGEYTIAQRSTQHVFGRYNIADTAGDKTTYRGNYIEIVGNGDGENTRSNARTLDWLGNEILAGKLTIGTAPTANMDVATKKYVDDGDSALSIRISTLENAGYITSYTETDPTVPEWAKAATKPTYTATEVGALPSSTTYVSSFNGNTGDITYTAPVTSVNGNTGTVVVDKLKLGTSQNIINYIVLGYNQTGGLSDNPQYIYDLGRLQFTQYTTNYARLILGDNKTPGVIRLYDNKVNTGGYLDLKPTVQTTATREINFPDASGTIALTTDIPSVPSWALANNKPSYTFSELTSHPTTLNDYGITDAYTKTEVDGLVSGVLHYKGAKSTTSALPSSGNITGDVWHVTADSSEWAWDGSEWQELGTTVDLSGYLQSSDISAWAKAVNKPSYTASEVGALPSSTTYVSSFNGQSGAITYIPPVSSVNGQTGVVNLSIPDVPSWALASSKPSYTASEVGALPSSTTYVSSFNGSTGAITYTAPVTSVNNQTGAVTLSIPTAPGDIGAASATHAHGNITSGGDMTATAAIASGDRLVINDESASKLVSSTITFGSSTTQYLANNGTWQNAYDDTALAARVSALEQIPWVTYYTGSTTPNNSQGNNGDLYFQTAQ